MDLGMDSLMAVELRNRLSKLLGVDSLTRNLDFRLPHTGCDRRLSAYSIV